MLPRDDVEQVYNALSAAPTRLTELYGMFPQYTRWQLQWAVGSLLVQDIIKEGDQSASDKKKRDSNLDIVQPFSNYIGWESAK